MRGANLRGIAARLSGLLPNWYPVPFGVAVVINQIADDGIALQAGIRALIVAVVVTAALSVAGRRLTRQADRGTLLGLAGFFVLLAGDESVWLLAAGAIAFLLLIDLRGARTGGRVVPWSAMRSGLSAVTVILLVLVTLPVLGSSTAFPSGPQPASSVGTPARPDIFVILLDGLAALTSWRRTATTQARLLPTSRRGASTSRPAVDRTTPRQGSR